jgi:hypothetical protein
VEWDWFRKNNESLLYWHWSPNYNWDMNFQIHGWNEALISYVLAASSPTHSIPKIVYDNGWALNGAIKNTNTYFTFNCHWANRMEDLCSCTLFVHRNQTRPDRCICQHWTQGVNHT